MLRSELCHFSDAYIALKGKISVTVVMLLKEEIKS